MKPSSPEITEDSKLLLQTQLRAHNLELTPDARFVRWTRDHPSQPRNWPIIRRIYDITLVSFVDLLVTATSTAGAAAASEAKHEYHLHDTLATFCFVTVFLLGQSVGTVLFPPWSESFGRKKMYIASTTLSGICCGIIGGVHSLPVAIVLRTIAGFLSAVPYTIGSGSIEDMFNSQARIWVFYCWTIASTIGLIIGPVMSSYIIEALDWRWVFYVYAIIFGGTTGLICLVRESRPSLLLAREVEKLRRQFPQMPPALNHDKVPDMHTFVTESLFRPIQLFFQEPLIFTIAMIIAISMSLIYIFTEALQPIYQSMGFTASQASLIFIAIGLGACFSAFTRVLDCYIFNRRKCQGHPIKPEDKLLGLALGAPILAIGLWWFGWTIPPKSDPSSTPWIVPTIPLVLVGYALTELDTVLYGYISDSYLSYSASATAAVAFLRGLLSGVFPLFTKQMFHGLGANIAVSVLAAVATVFCIVPPLFLRYGEEIRKRSQFAKYSLEIQAEMGKDENDV
ncbi:hypothetical protein N7492_008679 [Penicillium capsulatum]|uniref:Major facilitator superfamily (MFS) profile domain-containing protein n=1 Tax=Penicillium capsulatum TaxID=69766 RepID=A0A9W9LG54_9EURO|nr:hypothetical protein N7492_008679 [Penicillium capsulatum]KAJ6106083.1 hypothetical protein N7512_009600 [Penicillium capsulatum]